MRAPALIFEGLKSQGYSELVKINKSKNFEFVVTSCHFHFISFFINSAG